MPELRAFAQCIGLGADFSVLHDFFGLRSIPPAKELSLRQQMERLTRNHFHFNVILVGNDAFSDDELGDVNRAVFETREIYSKAGIGVGHVRWFYIPVSMAEGHEDIASESEAVALTDTWTVHNDGLDVFVVRDGWFNDGSAIDGASSAYASCEKDGGTPMSGSVVSVDSLKTALTMAHEIGHDLGLDHIVELDEVDEATEEQKRNLMFPRPLAGQLNPLQVGILLGAGPFERHCLMRAACGWPW